MSTRDGYPTGTFNWVDLMAHDMRAAGEFYAELFGWEVEVQDTAGGPPYAMFKQGDHVVAGLGETSPDMKAQGAPPMWNSYVSVQDAEATAARVEALGGKLLFPVMPVMEAGRMTFAMDREGAMFGIWEPGQHIGATLVNEPGSFCWNELYADDVEAVKDFYGELLGWTFEQVPHPTTQMLVIKNDGRDNGTVFAKGDEMAGFPSLWMTYFAVENCDATLEKLVSLGGKIHMPPMDIEPGRFAVVADPQGATFVVMQLAAPA